MLIFDIPRIYYPYACLACLRSSANIKRCSVCKIAAYCSKNHQISDWQHSHKRLCKIISNCDQKFTPNVRNFEEWTNYRVGRQLIWQTALKRDLNLVENLMNQFSPRCAVCYSKENLRCCRNCFNISYCSDEHQTHYSEKHEKYCDSFKLSLVTDQYINTKGLPDIKFRPIDKNILSCTKDIVKYLELLELNSNQNYLTVMQEFLIIDILKTERLTLGLNLLYTLNLIGYTGKHLVVHIIGTSNLELASNWEIITEILCYWLDISHITYYFIGPEIDSHIVNKKFKQYELIYHSCLYHQIVHQIDKPDLVAAFNCGLHEFENENTWSLSIPKLLHYKDVPLMLTSFTETELIRDRNIVLDLRYALEVILDVQKNPFAFLKPIRDWISEYEPIFYRCNYIYVVKREK